MNPTTINRQIKDKCINMNIPWICSGNSILESSVDVALTGLNFTTFPVNKVRIVHIEDVDFNNNIIISLISNHNTNIPKLIVKEMEYYREICINNGSKFTMKEINKIIRKYGYKMDERIPLESEKIQNEIIKCNFKDLLCKILYDETFNSTNIDEDIIIKIFKAVYVEFYKYIYYIYQSLTSSDQIEVELTSKFTRLTIYESMDRDIYKKMNSVDKKIQKFINSIMVEMFDFPFLIEMIDEIVIYKPKDDNLTNIDVGIVKNIYDLNQDSVIVSIQNSQISNYAYEFTDKFRDCLIYSNPFINTNIDLDLGDMASIFNSVDTLKAAYIDLILDNYSRIYSTFSDKGTGLPQIKDEGKYISEPYKSSDLKLNKLKNPISKVSKRMKIINDRNEPEYDNVLDSIEWGDESSINKKLNNEQNMTQKILNEKHRKLHNIGQKDGSEAWFEVVRNTIPILKTSKNLNKYKNIYNDVKILEYKDRMDNILEIYDYQANYPEYELDIKNLEEIYRIYPELDTITFEKLNLVNINPSKRKMYQAIQKSIQQKHKYFETIESNKEIISEITLKDNNIVKINRVDEEYLQNYLFYIDIEDAKNDIFNLSINNYKETKIYKSYMELFLINNIYNGEKYRYNNEELDDMVSYYLFSDKKLIEINRVNRLLKDNVEIWRDLYHNLNNFYDNNNVTNDYEVIEDLTEVVIYKFYNILNTLI